MSDSAEFKPDTSWAEKLRAQNGHKTRVIEDETPPDARITDWSPEHRALLAATADKQRRTRTLVGSSEVKPKGLVDEAPGVEEQPKGLTVTEPLGLPKDNLRPVKPRQATSKSRDRSNYNPTHQVKLCKGAVAGPNRQLFAYSWECIASLLGVSVEEAKLSGNVAYIRVKGQKHLVREALFDPSDLLSIFQYVNSGG